MQEKINENIVKRLGFKFPKPGCKIVIIGDVNQKREFYNIRSLSKSLSGKDDKIFLNFLREYGFQLVLFSYPQKFTVENISLDIKKELIRKFKLNIVKQEGKCVFLTIFSIHWSRAAEFYTLAGEYSNEGDLIVPNSKKILLNPPPFRRDPETNEEIRLHDPIFLILAEGIDPGLDIECALRDHSMIPSKMAYVSLEKMQDAELRNSFYLELPYLKKEGKDQDSKFLFEYGVKVLQDIIQCIVRYLLKLPQSLEKIILSSGNEISNAWYKGEEYINPPSMKFFR